MPEPGRPAADAGYQYQDLVAALNIAEMLADGDMASVWPEAFADVDDILVQRVGSPDSYAQVKESSPGAEWTAPSLDREGVLAQFHRQNISTPNAELILCTGSSARRLREPVLRARNAWSNAISVAGDARVPSIADAIAEWERRLGADGVAFATSCEELLQIDRPTLFTLFQSISVRDNFGEAAALQGRLEVALAHLVREPRRAGETILRLVRERGTTRRRISRSDVRSALLTDGIPLLVDAWAPIPDGEAYANEIVRRLTLLDVAQLPRLERTITSGSDALHPLDPSRIPIRTVLVGGHGSGKSRVAGELAETWLRQGRDGLLVRLGTWATDLSGAIAAELARAIGRAVAPVDVQSLLGRSAAFLVLDGLDEVPVASRDASEREIAELATLQPGLQVVVTTRPPQVARALGDWVQVRLEPVGDDQVHAVLGESPWTLPKALQELAHNPLMLGLIKGAAHAMGHLPTTESALLDTYLSLLVERDTQRSAAVDGALGQMALEEYGFEWLSRQRLDLNPEDLRAIGLAVAQTLRAQGYGPEVEVISLESWILNVGLAIRLADQVIAPAHRSLLDHLAGRALSRRRAAQWVGAAGYREAIAHYVGSNQPVTENLLQTLDRAAETDLELLARGCHLLTVDVDWSQSPESFGEAYTRALRLIEAGPLRGLRLLPASVAVRVDRGLTWLSEVETNDGADVIAVVEEPPGMWIVGPDGSRTDAITSFRMPGHSGRQIHKRLPHAVAFDRISEVLGEAVSVGLFPDEGADITYERLVMFRTQFERVFNLLGMPTMPGTSPGDLHLVTPRALLDRSREIAARFVNRAVPDQELERMLFAHVPKTQGPGLLTDAEPSAADPRDPSGRRQGIVVHLGALSTLCRAAEPLGLLDLPLHDLGLRPESALDPVLGLPSRLQALHGQDLEIYVERHQQKVLAAYRHLIERNIPGLIPALRTYRRLPLAFEMVIHDTSTPGLIDVSVHYRRLPAPGEHDEVTVRLGERPPDAGFQWSWANILSLTSVKGSAYRMVSEDLERALKGSQALGSAEL